MNREQGEELLEEAIKGYQEGGLMGVGKRLLGDLLTGAGSDRGGRQDDDSDDSDDDRSSQDGYRRTGNVAGDASLTVTTDHDEDDDIDGDKEFADQE